MGLDIKSLPTEYREIYNEYIMPVDTNIRMSDVILSDENKDKFRQFMTEQKFRDTFYKYGLEPMNRILMFGASGTGKTFSSKALCNELGYTMLYIDIAKALSDETVSKNLSEIFKLANYVGNCLVMLDECDSIAWRRDTSNSDTGIIRRATNTLFQQLDQMDHRIVFVAATNMRNQLDPAFDRRFNLRLEFRRPQIKLKEAIKHFMLPGFKYLDDVDSTTGSIVETRALDNKRLSYYEIQGLVERAMKEAIINGTMTIHTAKVYRDLAVQLNMKLRFNTAEDDEASFSPAIDTWNR